MRGCIFRGPPVEHGAFFCLRVDPPSERFECLAPKNWPSDASLRAVEFPSFCLSESSFPRLGIGVSTQHPVFCSQSIVSVALKLEICPSRPRLPELLQRLCGFPGGSLESRWPQSGEGPSA